MKIEKARMIANPISGKGKAFDLAQKVQKFLHNKGIEVECFFTKGPNEATEAARKAISEGYDAIFVAGGDGTINEVINGIAGSSIPLGIIPLGVSNVLAREMRIPLEPLKACEILNQGKIKKIDLGKAGERYFALMAGAGFDASVVQEVNRRVIRLLGRGAFYLVGLRRAIWSRNANLSVQISGQDSQISGSLVVVGNCSRYGGEFKVTPSANPTDGLLDVCLFTGCRRRDIFRYFMALSSGKHLHLDDVKYFRTKSLKLTSEEEIPLHLDAEMAGTLPVEISIVPQSLSLLVP